jgi:hypothetical protein
MGTESEGFPDEAAYEAAAQASLELTQQRLYEAQNLLAKREAEIARLENERDGKVREALLSLAAEFDDLAALTGTLAPTYLLGMADAARMARERAEAAPEARTGTPVGAGRREAAAGNSAPREGDPA